MITIHGKQLEQTEDGTAIYYDNIKIGDKNLNQGYSFEDWIRIISANENFDPRLYHPNLFGSIHTTPELLNPSNK